MTIDESSLDWQPLAARMTDGLVAGGLLSDVAWRRAFRSVPRHLFVPWFYGTDGRRIDGSDPDTRARWADEMYSDTSLVVQRVAAEGVDRELATSSSTMPSLMATMLDLLTVESPHRVLEIGTATGYNTALLCHRLGDGRVTSVELHPDLTASARLRLERIGYRPTLITGDGACGVPERAPFDRILATCAISTVPAAWITQLTRDGVIVADVRSELASNLAVLRKVDDDTVQGGLLNRPGHFMWLRPDPASPLLRPGDLRLVVDRSSARGPVATDIDAAILAEPGLRVLLGALEPGLQPALVDDQDGTRRWLLYTLDNRWAEIINSSGHVVTEGGPGPLWSSVERAVTSWLDAGRPGPERYGLTATVEGRHTYWVDAPGRTILER